MARGLSVFGHKAYESIKGWPLESASAKGGLRVSMLVFGLRENSEESNVRPP